MDEEQSEICVRGIFRQFSIDITARRVDMNAQDTGQAFMLEIMSTQKKNPSSKWSWERYVDGPVDNNFADTVCNIAGCWCYDNNAASVRFYTNSNHQRWGYIGYENSSNPWRSEVAVPTQPQDMVGVPTTLVVPTLTIENGKVVSTTPAPPLQTYPSTQPQDMVGVPTPVTVPVLSADEILAAVKPKKKSLLERIFG